MQYPDETIQSQYAASPTITALVTAFNTRIDPSADIQLFYDCIFNVATAQGVGLDWWGRIVGAERNIRVSTGEWLGFLGSGLLPFDQGVFYNGEDQEGIYTLSDDAFRQLIFWKALANISTADVATLNSLLAHMFTDRAVYILETDTVMHVRLVVETHLQPFERAIIENYGVMALGAGVGLEWLEVATPVLGFAGTGLAPFGQAPFFNGGTIGDYMDNSVIQDLQNQITALSAQVSTLQDALATLSRKAVFHDDLPETMEVTRDE